MNCLLPTDGHAYDASTRPAYRACCAHRIADTLLFRAFFGLERDELVPPAAAATPPAAAAASDLSAASPLPQPDSRAVRSAFEQAAGALAVAAGAAVHATSSSAAAAADSALAPRVTLSTAALVDAGCGALRRALRTHAAPAPWRLRLLERLLAERAPAVPVQQPSFVHMCTRCSQPLLIPVSARLRARARAWP